MKRLLTIFSLVVLTATLAQAQLIISEIMYNPPESGNDSLEYVEIYNASDIPVNLNGYSFINGIEYTFGDVVVTENGYIVVAKDSVALFTVTGYTALQWSGGSLKNDGELLTLADPGGVLVDSLAFGTSAPWPLFTDGAAGGGASIEFCIDENDNSLGENWKASTAEIGMTINALQFRGTPGAANSAVCSFPPAQTVIVTSNVFTPADITINIGDKVLWENQMGFHNVNGTLATYPDNPEGFGNGGAASAPWTYEFTFNSAGVYNYQCDPHVGLGMVGTVTVINDLPDLVITEIMYNDPSSDDVDSLEFVEIYNAGQEDASLGGIVFQTSIINYELPDTILPAGDFLIIQKTENGFIREAGVMTLSFENGGLSNNSDSVTLTSKGGVVIDQVIYMDSGDWPIQADGLGSSISLCDLTADNSDAANWQASSSITSREYEAGKFIFANPGAFNSCNYTIAEATATDINGLAESEGLDVVLTGLAYGVNLRPNGLQFTLIDRDNEGIGVFSASNNFGYELTEGDSLRLDGVISQFNGLVQINIDTLEVLSSGNTMIPADTVTNLDEQTESSLVTIKDVVILDPSDWSNSGSGFNVAVSNGTDTFQLRIDNDVTDLYDGSYPTGVFTVTGIGGQFDNSEPYLDGYQLLPRYSSDIEPYVPFVEAYPLKSIAEVTEVDQNGIAVALGDQVEIVGVAHGINFRPNGLQFTLIDSNNDGIGLFAGSNDFGYTYAEGDQLSIKGSIGQFNGLTQINPDSVRLITSGNDLQEPTVVDDLGEETESQYIKIESAVVLDPTQWAGDGGSFNVDIQTSSGANAVLRIDADSELSDKTLPGNTLMITGIGGQFDNSEPFTEGYQIFPSYEGDVVMVSSTEEVVLSAELVEIFPNPVQDVVNFRTEIEIERIEIYDLLGKKMSEHLNQDRRLDMSALESGQYVILFRSEEGVVVKNFMKIK